MRVEGFVVLQGGPFACMYTRMPLNGLRIETTEKGRCLLYDSKVSLKLEIGHSHYVRTTNWLVRYWILDIHIMFVQRLCLLDIGYWTFKYVCTVNIDASVCNRWG